MFFEKRGIIIKKNDLSGIFQEILKDESSFEEFLTLSDTIQIKYFLEKKGHEVTEGELRDYIHETAVKVGEEELAQIAGGLNLNKTAYKTVAFLLVGASLMPLFQQNISAMTPNNSSVSTKSPVTLPKHLKLHVLQYLHTLTKEEVEKKFIQINTNNADMLKMNFMAPAPSKPLVGEYAEHYKSLHPNVRAFIVGDKLHDPLYKNYKNVPPGSNMIVEDANLPNLENVYKFATANGIKIKKLRIKSLYGQELLEKLPEILKSPSSEHLEDLHISVWWLTANTINGLTDTCKNLINCRVTIYSTRYRIIKEKGQKDFEKDTETPSAYKNFYTPNIIFQITKNANNEELKKAIKDTYGANIDIKNDL